MNVIQRFIRISAAGYLVLLSSCVTPPKDSMRNAATVLPPETSFNERAGSGDWLYLNLHLKDGEELLFALDTGAPCTILDKSLTRKLGRIHGSAQIPYTWYGITNTVGVYRPPLLYLDNTPLRMGDWVLTDDLSWIWHRHRIMGVLGMDCLQHYCIQLNFKDHKLRFLDPKRMDAEGLGERFALSISESGVPYVAGNLVGSPEAKSEVDTGVPNDGALSEDLFQQQLRDQKPSLIRHYKTDTGKEGAAALLPTGVFGGETYTNLKVLGYSENVIGLRFLARHLVTFNFPAATMYLKREDAGLARSDRMIE